MKNIIVLNVYLKIKSKKAEKLLFILKNHTRHKKYNEIEMKKIKVLNLYAGIGGNRKLWKDVEVTAVEINEDIAKIYHDFFPNDTIIIGDAHQYLLKHYKEFDFIWSSPPCPSHSKIRFMTTFSPQNQREKIYPNMDLYQEIIFLKNYFKGKWVIENVISYYEPLIKPQEVQRHYFWSNFIISNDIKLKGDNVAKGGINFFEKKFGFDLSKYKGVNKKTLLRNCVEPKLGEHIFKYAFKEIQTRFK